MEKLQTERLNLKPIVEDDYNFVRFYLSDPERTRFLPLEKPYSEKETKEWFTNRILHWEKNNFGNFTLQENESKKIIGFCGLEYARDTDFIDTRYGLILKIHGAKVMRLKLRLVASNMDLRFWD